MLFPVLKETAIKTTFTFLFIFFIGITNAEAQTTPKRSLIAVSKADHTLSIVNPETLKVVATIPAGPNTHEIEISPDGRTAYVSNPGNSDLHEINVIDLEHQQKLPNIDTAPFLGPHGLDYKDGKLWFTAQGSKAVGRYDLTSKKIDWTMGTGQEVTHLIYVKEGEDEFYTTNVQSGTISLFEHKLVQPTVPPTGKLPPNAKPHWDWVQTLIPAGKGVEGFDVSKDEKELWGVTPSGVITIVDLEHKILKDTIETHIKGAHRLKFTPNGKQVVVVSVATGEVVKFDAQTRKRLASVTIAQGGEMLMDTQQNRLFIACPLDGYIAVVDLDKMKEINRFKVGGRPDGMAWAVEK